MHWQYKSTCEPITTHDFCGGVKNNFGPESVPNCFFQAWELILKGTVPCLKKVWPTTVGYGDNFGYDLSFSSFSDNTSGNFGLSFATLNTCVLEIQRFTVG